MLHSLVLSVLRRGGCIAYVWPRSYLWTENCTHSYRILLTYAVQTHGHGAPTPQEGSSELSFVVKISFLKLTMFYIFQGMMIDLWKKRRLYVFHHWGKTKWPYWKYATAPCWYFFFLEPLRKSKQLKVKVPL